MYMVGKDAGCGCVADELSSLVELSSSQTSDIDALLGRVVDELHVSSLDELSPSPPTSVDVDALEHKVLKSPA